jgi:Mg2+/Co2+ transporter CorB
VAIAALSMTLITFIFAEVAPKTYAVQQTDRAALTVAPFVYVLTRLPVLGPLARLLIAIGNVVTPGKGLKSGPFVSEDEIKAMVDEAERDEVIEEEEREMIHSIFEFGDTILREVMVPRPDMVAVPQETPLQQVLELILQLGLLPHPRSTTAPSTRWSAWPMPRTCSRASTTARPTSRWPTSCARPRSCPSRCGPPSACARCASARATW